MLHQIDTAWMALSSFTDQIKKRSLQVLLRVELVGRSMFYINPVQMNLYHKTAYYQLTSGSNGKTYIVGSGKFRRCNA